MQFESHQALNQREKEQTKLSLDRYFEYKKEVLCE